jgi:hypothetical protein
MSHELEDVEEPFVAQLQALGWTCLEGNLDAPELTGRSSFTEVIQEGVLRERLRALNPGPDGQPWLDAARLSEAVAAITRLGTHKLMEANEKATGLLIRGLTVEGLPGWDGGTRPDDPLHRLGHASEQPLHRRQPVPRGLPARLQQRQGLHRARPGAAGERHAAGGGGVQEPVRPRAAE